MNTHTDKYRNVVKQYDKGTISIPDHKIYEILWALHTNMILWDDIPPTFQKQFDLPHIRDYGIDLIDLDCTRTAQVKLYNSTSTVTWSHATNYVTYSHMLLNITNMSLFTTKDAKIDSLVQKLINDKKCNLQTINFDDLNNQVLTSIPQSFEVVPTTFSIEQRLYLVECTNLFISSPKPLLKFQLPCGVGKGYIMLNIIKQDLEINSNNKHIIICPWIDLAQQLYDMFKQVNISVNISVNMYGGKTRKQNDSNVDIVVAASNQKVIDKTYKYMFIDEYHHYQDEKSKYMQQIDKIKRDKTLCLSATFKNNDDLDYNMNLREAIDGGWLPDYVLHVEYFSQGDNTKGLVKLIKENLHVWGPIFIYFNTTERAIEFSKKLKEQNVSSEYLVGTDKKTKRKTIIDSVKTGDILVLCLCGMFNEGISIDNVQTVIFGDLRYSDINRIQISMRACRKHANKPFFRIVLPVTDTDFENNEDISDIIRTFHEIDPLIKKSCIERNTNRIRVHINHENEDTENEQQHIDADLISEQVYSSIGDILSDDGNRKDKWKGILEAAKKNVVNVEGRPNKRSDDAEEKRLGRWICTQITNYRKREQIMTDEEIRKLWESFINDPLYSSYFLDNKGEWKVNLDKVKPIIITKKGRPSPTSKDAEEKRLCNWLQHQITNYKNRKDIMNEDDIRKLWESFINDPLYSSYFLDNKSEWKVNLENVKPIIVTKKGRPSERSKDSTEKRLAKWINHQITNYKKREYIMEDEDIRKLWESFITDPLYSSYF